jgi:hypothetical protein
LVQTLIDMAAVGLSPILMPPYASSQRRACVGEKDGLRRKNRFDGHTVKKGYHSGRDHGMLPRVDH